MDQKPTPGLGASHESEDAPTDPKVAAALRRLAELDDQAVDEHPVVYADIDDELRSALGSTDQERT